jgi:hypothetical protein
MVENSLKSSIGTCGKTRLLDELISIGEDIGHLSIINRDKIICVHEKPHCYNICNIGRDVDNKNRKSGSKSEAFTGIEAKGVN